MCSTIPPLGVARSRFEPPRSTWAGLHPCGDDGVRHELRGRCRDRRFDGPRAQRLKARMAAQPLPTDGASTDATTSDVSSVSDSGDPADAPIADTTTGDRFETGIVDATSTEQWSRPVSRLPLRGGPNMVRVPTVDGRSYCIDATEVTQAQYSQFLFVKKGDTSGQEARCTWNMSYGVTCGGFDPVARGGYPVVCIDWCDAVAFCSWAGKRLCGKIGGGSLTTRPRRRGRQPVAGGLCLLPRRQSTLSVRRCREPSALHLQVPQRRCLGVRRERQELRGRLRRALRPDRKCRRMGGRLRRERRRPKPGDMPRPRRRLPRGDLGLLPDLSSTPRRPANDWGGFRCCAD